MEGLGSGGGTIGFQIRHWCYIKGACGHLGGAGLVGHCMYQEFLRGTEG